MKALLLKQLKEDGGLERARREVTKLCSIVEKALLLFDRSLSLLRTDHIDQTPYSSQKYATEAVVVWQLL
jgi:hypothetical protein